MTQFEIGLISLHVYMNCKLLYVWKLLFLMLAVLWKAYLISPPQRLSTSILYSPFNNPKPYITDFFTDTDWKTSVFQKKIKLWGNHKQ